MNKSGYLITAAVFFGALFGVLTVFFLTMRSDLPQISSLETFEPSAITRIYSADNILIHRLFKEKRDPVSLNSIPLYIRQGLIATEDRNFYSHFGVDIRGILRAAVKDLIAGEFIEGASTITQQLAKTLFLTRKKTLTRKIKEAIIAVQIERRFTKDEILGIYLNQIYFGSGAYGVQSAARVFFGKPLDGLTLAESALISGMPKAPSLYSPHANPELAVKRRNIVLRQMFATGVISGPQYEKACKEPLNLASRVEDGKKAPYFADHVKKELERILGPETLYHAGLKVYTTLNLSLQKKADQAIKNGLIKLDRRTRAHRSSRAEAALIGLDASTGAILTMTGGRNYSQSPFNRATSSRRQPGSAFKPILFALAVESGFSQSTMLLDTPVTYKGSGVNEWTPKNFSKNYKGEITLRTALALSKNIPAVRLAEMLGPASLVDFAHKMGIESKLSPDLSLSLGTCELNLLELTSAYSTFVNRGQYIKPFCIVKILSSRGEILWKSSPCKHLSMSRETAAIMTDMLMAVITEGTGSAAKICRGQVAGKTGTTDNYRDALFIGFSPRIITGVWTGLDNNESLGPLETGARAALPIWTEFMTAGRLSGGVQYFDSPDDMVYVNVSRIDGRPVRPGDPDGVRALYREGNAP